MGNLIPTDFNVDVRLRIEREDIITLCLAIIIMGIVLMLAQRALRKV